MHPARPMQAPARPSTQFPVVCVGGSAGGLDAYIRLLKCLPAELGAATVIVKDITRFPTRPHTMPPQQARGPHGLRALAHGPPA